MNPNKEKDNCSNPFFKRDGIQLNNSSIVVPLKNDFLENGIQRHFIAIYTFMSLNIENLELIIELAQFLKLNRICLKEFKKGWCEAFVDFPLKIQEIRNKKSKKVSRIKGRSRWDQNYKNKQKQKTSNKRCSSLLRTRNLMKKAPKIQNIYKSKKLTKIPEIQPIDCNMENLESSTNKYNYEIIQKPQKVIPDFHPSLKQQNIDDTLGLVFEYDRSTRELSEEEMAIAAQLDSCFESKVSIHS